MTAQRLNIQKILNVLLAISNFWLPEKQEIHRGWFDNAICAVLILLRYLRLEWQKKFANQELVIFTFYTKYFAAS
jgi:hypothetical protein